MHLMRDNDEVLTNPFDDPLKEIVTAFAKLLKPWWKPSIDMD